MAVIQKNIDWKQHKEIKKAYNTFEALLKLVIISICFIKIKALGRIIRGLALNKQSLVNNGIKFIIKL